MRGFRHAKVIAAILEGSPVRAEGSAAMSPARSKGVFDAIGRAGVRVSALTVPILGRVYVRADNGLVPARSRGSKPTMLFEEI